MSGTGTWTAAGVLFIAGMACSAFFSGTETGMYRVSRTRLVLDALGGSRVARGLVWLLNHPTYFVATALVGNNLANYAVSSAVVLAVSAVVAPVVIEATAPSVAGEVTGSIELIATAALAPVVFVLGELVPKHIFYRAPYRGVSLAGPLLLLAAVVLSPLAIVFSWLGQLLQRFTGQTPFRLRLLMNRGQLDRVLRDGADAGILTSGQRELATRMFEVGDRPAIHFAIPASRLATIESFGKTAAGAAGIQRTEAMRQARRRNHPIILIRRGGEIVGFAYFAELASGIYPPPVHPVLEASDTDRQLRLLLQMYDTGRNVAILRDKSGTLKGVVTRRQLIGPIVKQP